MSILHFIRHGQSQNNALPVAERVEDPPLTPEGVRQALLAGQALENKGITKIICSPFRRTLESTKHLCHSVDAPVELWLDTFERGGCMFGGSREVFEGRPGMKRSEIETEFPRFTVPETLSEGGWWNSRPFESVSAAEERARGVIRRIHQSFERDEKVVMVSHGTFGRIFIAQCLGLQGEDQRSLGSLLNASICTLLFDEELVTLCRYNDVEHLPDELRSDLVRRDEF